LSREGGTEVFKYVKNICKDEGNNLSSMIGQEITDHNTATEKVRVCVYVYVCQGITDCYEGSV